MGDDVDPELLADLNSLKIDEDEQQEEKESVEKKKPVVSSKPSETAPPPMASEPSQLSTETSHPSFDGIITRILEDKKNRIDLDAVEKKRNVEDRFYRNLERLIEAAASDSVVVAPAQLTEEPKPLPQVETSLPPGKLFRAKPQEPKKKDGGVGTKTALIAGVLFSISGFAIVFLLSTFHII